MAVREKWEPFNWLRLRVVEWGVLVLDSWPVASRRFGALAAADVPLSCRRDSAIDTVTSLSSRSRASASIFACRRDALTAAAISGSISLDDIPKHVR